MSHGTLYWYPDWESLLRSAPGPVQVAALFMIVIGMPARMLSKRLSG
jgi:hypothetical protein